MNDSFSWWGYITSNDDAISKQWIGENLREKTSVIFANLIEKLRRIINLSRWGKYHPRTGHKDTERESRYNFILSLTSDLDGTGWTTPRLGCFNPRGKIRYMLYRKQSGPQGRSGRVRKISPHTEIGFPDHPSRSESQCRLSCPGPLKLSRSALNPAVHNPKSKSATKFVSESYKCICRGWRHSILDCYIIRRRSMLVIVKYGSLDTY